MQTIAEKVNEASYKVTFDIQPFADKIGISKEKCAELLADEIMKIIGLI